MLLTLFIAGCGGSAGATPRPTATRPPEATPTQQVIATAPVAAATAIASATLAPPATPRPTPHPTRVATVAAPQPERVVDATLRPFSVSPRGALSAQVITTGPVTRVELYLGSGLPGTVAPITLTLTQSAAGTWTGSGTAPSQPGEYHYTVGLFVRGVRTIIDNDGWNIKVTGGSSSGGSTSTVLPADIPLAPPFSYGNPVPAVFSAEGKTVNGSEVVSTTRTDVAPATVSEWYSIHFPRAGWTIDPATVPAAGAAAFTMVATSGNRVCVVDYSSSTVHVFYGSLAG